MKITEIGRNDSVLRQTLRDQPPAATEELARAEWSAAAYCRASCHFVGPELRRDRDRAPVR
jgi:hypothetical protein